MMRVGFVIDDDINSNNGVQQGVHILSKWLRERGHETIIFSGRGRDKCSNEMSDESHRSGFNESYAIARTVEVRFNGNRVSTPLIPRSLDFRAASALRSCDVVHVQAPYGPLVGHRVIAGARKDTKVIASFHMAPANRGVVKCSKILSWLLRRSQSRIDSVTCDSEVSKGFLQETWGDLPVSIIGNPWRRDDFVQSAGEISSSSGEVLRIVFVGRLVERKGCRYLLDAFALMDEQIRSRVKLEVIGDGPLRGKLESLAWTLGIHNSVDFLGCVSEEKKRERLACADLAVFPATGGESFGVVLLEAIASGCPAIGFNNPGYSSVLGTVDCALVPVGDVGALSQRMAGLCRSSERRSELLCSEQAAIDRFEIDVIGEKYLEVYTA